jgi:hypothetical protein
MVAITSAIRRIIIDGPEALTRLGAGRFFPVGDMRALAAP